MAEYIQRRSGSLGSHTAQEQRKKESQDRKRSILYLILGYLKDNNLKTSYDALKTEAQLGDQYTVCDNVDLDIILQEYRTYYTMKFQKEPQIIRKSSLDDRIPSLTQKTQSAGRMRTLQQKEKEQISFPKEKNENFHLDIISLDSQDKIPEAGGRRRSSQNSDQEKKRLLDYSGIFNLHLEPTTFHEVIDLKI